MGSFSTSQWGSIKILRIDVYLFLFMLGYYIGQVPTTQLIEDKICINELSLGVEFCQNFDTTSKVTESERLTVLDRTTTIKNWQTILSTIPGVAISLFTGFWIDFYPSHIRYLLMLPCFSIALQSITLLLQCVHFKSGLFLTYWSFLLMGIGGSIPLVLTCSFTYVARKTSQEHRSLRFALVELFLLTAQPAATALGARILASPSWFHNERRNFIGVYLTNAVIMMIAALWVGTLLNDCETEQDKRNQESDIKIKSPSSSSVNPEEVKSIELSETKSVINSIPKSQVYYYESTLNGNNKDHHSSSIKTNPDAPEAPSNTREGQAAQSFTNNPNKRISIQQSSTVTRGDSSALPIPGESAGPSDWSSSIRSIINIQNVISTFKTCLRARPHGQRGKLINICFAIFILFISLLSESYFGFQFTEEVFHWDYRYYSNVNAALLLIQAFGAILGTALFKNCLHFQDSTLAALATLSHLLSNLFKGIGYQETYILGYIVYGISGMSIPSARSTLTQIIDFHEIAQVFTILSCIQAASPMVSSVFCTAIFKATLASLPGATYHAVSILLFYPLGVFLWINISSRKFRSHFPESPKTLNRDLSRGLEDLRETTVNSTSPSNDDNNNGFVNHAFSSKF